MHGAPDKPTHPKAPFPVSPPYFFFLHFCVVVATAVLVCTLFLFLPTRLWAIVMTLMLPFTNQANYVRPSGSPDCSYAVRAATDPPNLIGPRRRRRF